MSSEVKWPFRIVCVLAEPRTGSTLLLKILNSTEMFMFRGELFNPNSLSQISNRERKLMADRLGDDAYINTKAILWRRENPESAISDIISDSAHKTLLMKISNFHLSRENMISSIFQRSDILYILLKRRPIEAYISTMKARHLSKWHEANTTDLKLEIDETKFINWAEQTRKWYDFIAEHSQGSPRIELGYERHLKGQTTLSIMSHINAELQTIGMPHLGLGLENVQHRQQDLETNYQRRVSNWDDFETKLRSTQKGTEMLNWAETIP